MHTVLELQSHKIAWYQCRFRLKQGVAAHHSGVEQGCVVFRLNGSSGNDSVLLQAAKVKEELSFQSASPTYNQAVAQLNAFMKKVFPGWEIDHACLSLQRCNGGFHGGWNCCPCHRNLGCSVAWYRLEWAVGDQPWTSHCAVQREVIGILEGSDQIKKQARAK